jgi:hypothetical protein
MRTSMIAAAVAAVVVLAAAVGADAATAPSSSYQVAGFATVTPQGTTTSLAGLATGSAGDRGFVSASITTAPLAGCSSIGSSCAITGGTLGLNGRSGSELTATFTSGSVALTAQAPGCGRQQFTVYGIAATGDGDVVFTAVLTQFRLSFRGACFTLPGEMVAGSFTVGQIMGG